MRQIEVSILFVLLTNTGVNMILSISETGITIKTKHKFISYSLYNFNASHLETESDRLVFQHKKWTRFLNLLIRVSKDLTIIKNNTVVFTKK